jgi:IclR family transcriptional regulator, mhp operon transcriptional activator
VAEAAAPVLHRLCEKVKWPSDLFVPAGSYMDRRETSRRHSPFLLPPSEVDRVGRHVGYLMTAIGRAYLAWCPEEELQRILSRLRKQNRPGDFLAHNPAKLDRILAQTRQRGYATRDASFAGGSLAASPVDDGMAAIAVPLFDGSHNHGAINILWIRTAFTVEAFATRHLGDLQQAAQEIVTSLKSRISS